MGAIERMQQEPVKTCLECRGEMIPTFADLTYDVGELTIVVKDVPVNRCQNCGAQYVPGPIGLEIGDAVDELIRLVRQQSAKRTVARTRSIVMETGQRGSVATFAMA